MRRVTVVSLETFTVWLARLTATRVKPEARETVIAYQREAGRALRGHFFGQPTKTAGDDLDVIENMVAAIRADRTKIAALEAGQRELAARIESTAGSHDWFTALGYAKLHDFPTDRPYLSKVGTRAGRMLRARGEEPIPRQDATFGSINTYPVDVLGEAFAAVTR